MSSSASLKDKEIAPHVALIAVQVMFGTWPIFGKIVLRTVSSTGLVGVRILGATVVFALFHRKAREILTLSKSTLGSLLLCSLLGVVINQLLFVKGLSYTTVINATLITTTIPVFTLAISIILGHDRATWRHILGIALAAAGVAYLVNPFRATLSAQNDSRQHSDRHQFPFVWRLHSAIARSGKASRCAQRDYLVIHDRIGDHTANHDLHVVGCSD